MENNAWQRVDSQRRRSRGGESIARPQKPVAENKNHDIIVVNLPTTTTSRNLFALAGDNSRPVSVRMLRNKTTLAPLGCAVISCSNRRAAEALARKLDGSKLGRNRLRARSDLLRLGTVRVRCDLTRVHQLRPVLEQCGTLVEIQQRDDCFLATFSDGASAAAAQCVLDRSVVDSCALRVEHYEEEQDHRRDEAKEKRHMLIFPRADLGLAEAPEDIEALAPLGFECGGETWKVGVWGDVKLVCEMTGVRVAAFEYDLVVVVLGTGGYISGDSSLSVSLNSRNAVDTVKSTVQNCRLFLFKDDDDSPLRFVFEIQPRQQRDDDSCGSTTQVATERTAASSEDKESAFETDDDDLGKSAKHKNKLGLSLLRMWENGIETDCSIACDDGCDVVRAHRAVLAARSAFFHRHFVERKGSEKVFLNAEPSRIVRAVCCFAYADELVGSHADIIDHAPDIALLLDAASRYEIFGLAEYVSESLRPKLHFLEDQNITSDHASSVGVLEKLREDTKALQRHAAEADFDLAKYYLQHEQTPRIHAKVKANINAENLVDLFQLAAAIPSEPLKRDCLAYAKAHLQTVMAQQGFTNYLQSRSDLVFDLLSTINN